MGTADQSIMFNEYYNDNSVFMVRAKSCIAETTQDPDTCKCDVSKYDLDAVLARLEKVEGQLAGSDIGSLESTVNDVLNGVTTMQQCISKMVLPGTDMTTKMPYETTKMEYDTTKMEYPETTMPAVETTEMMKDTTKMEYPETTEMDYETTMKAIETTMMKYETTMMKETTEMMKETTMPVVETTTMDPTMNPTPSPVMPTTTMMETTMKETTMEPTTADPSMMPTESPVD